jgi:hypothetical protein
MKQDWHISAKHTSDSMRLVRSSATWSSNSLTPLPSDSSNTSLNATSASLTTPGNRRAFFFLFQKCLVDCLYKILISNIQYLTFRAREALRQCLPEPLRDATFAHVLKDDPNTKRCLSQLLFALSDSSNNSSNATANAANNNNNGLTN